MRLTHLSLTQFRNFSRLDMDVPRGSVLVIGNNAQGKTSILESIYFLSTFSSFHASSDRELINFLEAYNPLAVSRIVADIEREDRSFQLQVRLIQERARNGVVRARKEVLINGVQKKVSELIGQFKAVLFLPQMMQIVEGSPSERRRYLDMAISQVFPGYVESLSKYNKLITQRNALLKQLGETGGDQSQLDYWDERVAKHGAEIMDYRIQAIHELEKITSELLHELTSGKEILRIDYQPAFDPLGKNPKTQFLLIDEPKDRTFVDKSKLEKKFLKELTSLRREEIARGLTTIGPHRDELRFISNRVDLGIYGSRGQVRTLLLALKMAEMKWIQCKTGMMPVLLLDEIMAELDDNRSQAVLYAIAESEQALLSTTDLNPLDKSFIDRSEIWQVDEGRVRLITQ
ncbi:MAG: DNA replication/repair protein RecF [Anaerolineales bacterium]|nr:DNA replication/repair protein RecF [Anaerolineales bacterium]